MEASPSHVSGHQLHQAAQLLIRAAEQLSDSPATGGSGGNQGGQTSRQQQPQSSGTSGTRPSGRCAATSLWCAKREGKKNKQTNSSMV